MKVKLIGALAVSLIVATFLSVFGFAAAKDEGTSNAQLQKVDYPTGYRHWTHVKSMNLLDNHPIADIFGGLHHIYANDLALEAMEKGTPYPDGAVLVFDLLEVSTDAEETATVEGARIRLDVMQKNEKLWPDTSGWGYETFKGTNNERIISDPIASCHGCHASKVDSDFVFSNFRE